MANTTTDPNTGILIPVPGQDPGPDYATNISNALTTLSALTHTGAPNDGLQIPAAGININADLSAQSHNITDLRSARFTQQDSTLRGVGDISCLFDVNGELYYNDGNGNHVQITDAGQIRVITSNNFNTIEISSNHTINSTDANVVFNASISSAPIVLTLPTANGVSAGHTFFVKDKLGTSTPTNYISITPAGADTIDKANAAYKLQSVFSCVILISDGISNWQLYRFANNFITSKDPNGGTIKLVDGYISLDSQSAIDSLGNVNIQSGALTVSSGATFITSSASTTQIEAGNSSSFIELFNHSTLSTDSTNVVQLNINSTGYLDVNAGATATFASTATLHLASGSALTASDGSTVSVSGTLAFSPTAIAAINQTSTSSTSGTDFTLQSQSTTHSGSTGGNLILKSGQGPTGFDGYIALETGSSTSPLVQAYPQQVQFFPLTTSSPSFTGSALTIGNNKNAQNTQLGINNITQYFAATTASGSNVSIVSWNVPNLTGLWVVVKWLRRGLTGSGLSVNEASITAIANGAGSLTTNTATALYSGSGFDSVANLSFSTSTNTLSLAVVAQSTAADWQLLVQAMGI